MKEYTLAIRKQKRSFSVEYQVDEKPYQTLLFDGEQWSIWDKDSFNYMISLLQIDTTRYGLRIVVFSSEEESFMFPETENPLAWDFDYLGKARSAAGIKASAWFINDARLTSGRFAKVLPRSGKQPVYVYTSPSLSIPEEQEDEGTLAQMGKIANGDLPNPFGRKDS